MHRRSMWILIFLVACAPLLAQSPTATIDGRVLDPAKAVIEGSTIHATNIDTNVQYATHSNPAGLFTIVNLPPGTYRIEVSKPGFRTIVNPGVVLHVQDVIALNFDLPVGSISESITVAGGAPLVNTQDAAVSTVVDRNFAENLPMNGRSFQTLIELTPGVVLANTGGLDTGQFSVNGQRASANYWMVDGVSANVASSTQFGGNGAAGAIGTSSVLGGTNSLVSVDALQEFRIQTSTFAPEFGRTPGAQISIVTRSGTNRLNGAVFDYLRNDVLDANNWFNGYTNHPPLPKAEERQNDFGGTLGGPIQKDRTFFFFSYEGLRLRLPETTFTAVPDLNARINASSTMQPYLNAYPFDPNQPDFGDGSAQFNSSFSNPAKLDAYSVRIDHKLSNKMTLFGRYVRSPSDGLGRGIVGNALSSVLSSSITTQTATIGSDWILSARANNEVRINYSRTNALGRAFLDDFGGAVPVTSLAFPNAFNAGNARLVFHIFSLAGGSLQVGQNVRNLQRQVNMVDTVSVQTGKHSLKAGVDYRRLSPKYEPFSYGQLAFLTTVDSAESGSLLGSIVQSRLGATLSLKNLGLFVQDTWRVSPRLTATYGLRWDTDFAPSSTDGPSLPAATGFNLSNLSSLALAPTGTPAFKTTFGNVAPRVGVAYQLSQRQDWAMVIRGGFGIFYDLATSEVGNVLLAAGYPFAAQSPFTPGGTFPLDTTAAMPPSIEPPNSSNQGRLVAFDPNLKLPYTPQWNLAVEQGMGARQSLSASYVGSIGRRLIQTSNIFSPNANLGSATLVANTAKSDYHGLQVQFNRQMLRGIQALASYTWSHSIDTASAGSFGNASNLPASGANQSANRASSDFDVRHAFSAGITITIPATESNPFLNVIGRGWSLQSIIQVHSSAPVTVFDGNFTQITNGFAPDVRPDVSPSIPLYLYGSQFPGGWAINNTPGAVTGGCPDGSESIGPFCPPPTDTNGNPLRQGSLARNALRGFPVTQWDFALHRDFPIHESLILEFRAEVFNLLNHPNFGPPIGDLSDPQFGLSTQMYGQSLGGGNLGGSGSLSPLYQIGGPRSVQLALKLTF